MVKAVFEKGERVFVRAIGAWATIEAVQPHWVKGVDEPMKVTYELGLGRPFAAGELARARPSRVNDDVLAGETWRLRRAYLSGLLVNPTRRNSGTAPVVLTGEEEAGGWRLEAAEYDRDPDRYEHQARVIAEAPRLLRAAKLLAAAADGGPLPPSLEPALREAAEALQAIYAGAEPSEAAEAAAGGSR